MRIATVKHKGLKRFIEIGDRRGLLAGRERRIHAILDACRAAKDLRALGTVASLNLHPLKGERKGQWSVTVSGNWRLTFREAEGELFDLDLEDYH
jgi:toxin HigB-1